MVDVNAKSFPYGGDAPTIVAASALFAQGDAHFPHNLSGTTSKRAAVLVLAPSDMRLERTGLLLPT